MGQTSLSEFGRIDKTADPAPFIRFLDAASAEGSFQAYKQRLIQLLDVGEGQRILDVGCGTGDDVREMARIVGSAGQVIGVDNSQAMLAEARRRAAGTGLPVEFRAADALALPFEADHFDGCRCDRSLMHVPDARRALAEMVRVTRPGGRLAVYEVDFETLVIDTGERVLARKVAHFWCDSLRDGWLGRRVGALFRDLGLAEVTVTAHTLMLSPPLAMPLLGAPTVQKAIEKGGLTSAEGEAWLAHLDELERTGRFFSTLTGYLVGGRKQSGPSGSAG
jgi:ubiquinone/menaquinone biosynthesis C-methylase UbiE